MCDVCSLVDNNLDKTYYHQIRKSSQRKQLHRTNSPNTTNTSTITNHHCNPNQRIDTTSRWHNLRNVIRQWINLFHTSFDLTRLLPHWVLNYLVIYGLFIFVLDSNRVQLSVNALMTKTNIAKKPAWTIPPQQLRYLGEDTLREGRVLTQIYDAIEFPVVHIHSKPYLLLQYFIGVNRSFWFTVTPCISSLDKVQFREASAYFEHWEESKMHGLNLDQTRSQPQPWRYQPITVEPFPGQSALPNYNISEDGDKVRNVSRSRMHYSQVRYEANTLNIRLYGNPGDTYFVRLSTRRSPTHTYDGYPIVSNSLRISVCLVDDTNDTLDIHWDQALSIDMRPSYCVAINADEDLYYRCTAMTRLSGDLSTNSSKISRPLVFQDTDKRRPPTIKSYVYHCVNKAEARIKLPPSLAEIFHRLNSSSNRKLFINVYAVNKKIDLSTAYPVKIIQHSQPNLCGSRRAVFNVPVTFEPITRFLPWNKDIVFEWMPTHHSGSLYYQPCRLLGNQSVYYQIRVLYQTSRLNGEVPHEICQHSIRNGQVFPICFHSKPGIYWLKIDGKTDFMNGEPVARFFFLSPKANLLPRKAKNAILYTRLDPMITKATFNASHLPRSRTDHTPKPKRIKRHYHPRLGYKSRRSHYYRSSGMWKRFRRKRSDSHSNIPSSNPRRIVRSHRVRQLEIGVDCETHHLFIDLPIDPNPHLYHIHTIPLDNELFLDADETLERLQNITDYCELPIKKLSAITRFSWMPIVCNTSQGEESLRLPIPAYSRGDKARFYLLLIYASHLNDTEGVYEELFVQQILDSCKITYSMCYPKLRLVCSSTPESITNESTSDMNEHSTNIPTNSHHTCKMYQNYF